MPTIHRAEKATYQWLRQNYSRVTNYYSEKDLQALRKEFMNKHESYQIDLSLMRRDMLAQLAIQFDYPVDSMVEQGFELFYRLRHDVSFYEDVFPVIQKLRGQYRLGSISNGNASAGLTALDDYFDFYINAADVMARKPSRIIYQAFCDSLEVQPEHCLYVGDDPVYDVVGARDAGMQTIWVNRENSRWPDELQPAQAEINNLYQLLELVHEV